MTTPIPSPELQLIATRIMSGLLGWRWTWPPRRVTEKYQVPYGCQTVTLWGRPVLTVHSVLDQQTQPINFELSGGHRLDFPNWWGGNGLWIDSNYPPSPYLWPNMFPRPGTTIITVEYTYGSEPAPDVQRAIDQLADQFARADMGGACQLPERVTSVVRDGVSWTLIDPQDFLDKGRTGLYYVDLVLKVYSGGKTRSMVVSPEAPPPRRLSSVQVDDGTSGPVTAPAVPVSAVPVVSPFLRPVQITLTGTVTDVAVDGLSVGLGGALTGAMFMIPALSSVTLTYPGAAPTWVWAAS